jgi:hypothetical protein
MKLLLPLKSIFKPSTFSMIAVAVSFAAWSFPTFGVLRKGFQNPERLTLAAGVVLACWYLLIFISFVIGQGAGALCFPATKPIKSRILELDSNVIYYSFTLIGAVGMIAMLLKIFSYLSIQEAIVFIGLGQTNALKNSIYDADNYSIGLVSLRYMVLFPSSLALYRIIRMRQYSLVNLLNVLLLALATFLSSRLMLMAAMVTTTYLLTYDRKSMKFSIVKVAFYSALIFLLLSVLNISRNAAFYERNKLSFAAAGASEILSYVGSPFQAAIGSATITDQLVAGNSYRNFVDIEETLNTNSAFVLLHEQMGYVSWPYIAGICMFMGFVFEALASLGKTIFLLPCGAILYGSAELWRLDLFHQGTFIVWFVVGIGLPAFLIFVGHLRGSLGRLWKMPVKS